MAQWVEETAVTQILGPLQTVETLKERPWSLVRRLTFTKGVAFFKACGVGGQHEPALLSHLASSHFPYRPHLLASEPQRGWLLLADGGRPLRDEPFGLPQRNTLADLLEAYATLQQALRQQIRPLLALGLPDRRPPRLPALLENLPDDKTLRVGLTAEELAEVAGIVGDCQPLLAKICNEMPPLASLEHGDLHLGNVLAQNDVFTLIDWGDSCITHPFCTLLVTLEATRPLVAKEDWEETAVYLRDAYLSAWGNSATQHATLRRALWLAHLLRILNFLHMVQGADEASLRQWMPLVVKRLRVWQSLKLPEEASSWLGLLEPR